MKLNELRTIWNKADIDYKDVVWDFITENLENVIGNAAWDEKGKYLAVFYPKLVYLHHTKHRVIIESTFDMQSVLNVANQLIEWTTYADADSDIYAEIVMQSASKDGKHHMTQVEYFHTNTDHLRCDFSFFYDDHEYSGHFFLDMLNDDIYEGIHEGIPGNEGCPDEHIFYHIVPMESRTDQTFEVQVRLHTITGEITDAEVYLCQHYPDGHAENFDTIDSAHITITDINTNQSIFV